MRYYLKYLLIQKKKGALSRPWLFDTIIISRLTTNIYWVFLCARFFIYVISFSSHMEKGMFWFWEVSKQGAFVPSSLKWLVSSVREPRSRVRKSKWTVSSNSGLPNPGLPDLFSTVTAFTASFFLEESGISSSFVLPVHGVPTFPSHTFCGLCGLFVPFKPDTLVVLLLYVMWTSWVLGLLALPSVFVVLRQHRQHSVARKWS
jgi:hypothetical protein